jgi:hypothetical protein
MELLIGTGVWLPDSDKPKDAALFCSLLAKHLRDTMRAYPVSDPEAIDRR